MKKHVSVLEQAGLVATQKVGRVRTCRLGARTLAEEAAWIESYRRLWAELTEQESFELGERWRVNARIRRLNDLGFDVEEYSINTEPEGSRIHLQPKVVDAGHHPRRLA